MVRVAPHPLPSPRGEGDVALCLANTTALGRLMTRTGYFARLAFSVVIDLFDFSLGRALFFGSVTEGVGTVVLLAMWGPIGLVNLAELVDFSEQIDGFIPTATLIALYVGWRQGHLTGRANPTASSVPAPTPEQRP